MADIGTAGSGAPFDAFLSYARADDPDFIDDLVSRLLGAGIRLWFDRDSLPSRGTTFDHEIRRAIESSARLVLVVGPGGLASDYVAQEWGFADDLGVPVLPVLRNGVFEQLPDRLRSYHAVDARPPRSVESAVAELVRLLSEPVLQLGPCHDVPRPAAHELARPDLIERLWVALGVDRQRPQEAGRAPRSVVLYGVSGVGKSTQAAAFARSVRSRRTFPDGIAWVRCGPEFQPLAGARSLLAQIAVGAKLPGREEEIPAALAEGLAGRDILLVLDDVRDPCAVDRFMGALGPGARSLLTALDQAVATALGAIGIPVDQLDDSSARLLLEGWAGGALPSEADAVLAETDGLPFALSIVGAMISNRVPWARVVEALGARRLDLLQANFPGYPHASLLRALAASYDALAEEDPRSAQCFIELAAFRPGALLTESVVIRLWSRPGRLSTLEAALVLPVLERRLLVHRRSSSDGDHFFLHGLHEDFVRLECPNAGDLETALVSTYRMEKGSAGWATLPDDGYLYEHLIAHLASLGDREELSSAVDADWVRRQTFRRGDLGQALDDVRLALDLALATPLDLPTVARLSLLSGQVVATLRDAPPLLVGAMAEVGDIDQAVRWAADKPDANQRFEALVAVAEALHRRGDLALARSVIRTVAATIPLLGSVVETGLLPGLTALNAIHALVDFPFPGQWEATTGDLVAVARVPLDAVVRLTPLAVRVGAVGDVATVRHPFWEPYGHLIPLVAVEQLANAGDLEAAGLLLDAVPPYAGEEDDLAHADRYRRAIAMAALGRFDYARVGVEALPADYRGVGYRGLARHLATAGRAEEALPLLTLIDDGTVGEQARRDVFEATIERSDPEECRQVATFALELDLDVAAGWLLAAGNDPSLGLQVLDRIPGDELRLRYGIRLGRILLRRGRVQEAQSMARRLVPVAERLLGPQWFAPETTGVDEPLANLGRALLYLVVAIGEPLPDGLTPLLLLVEATWESPAPSKLPLIMALAVAGRLAEARELAGRSATPYGHALGLATFLATSDASSSTEESRHAVRELLPMLDDADSSSVLDVALGAATRIVMVGGLLKEADELVQRLLPREGLWSAIGVWASERAKAGHAADVRELSRRLLIERPLRRPDARARARVLSALAAQGQDRGDELEGATTLLADLEVGAGALDCVFEVVQLLARQDGLDAASSFTLKVGEGASAKVLEELLQHHSVAWEAGSEHELAAAAAVRAVAAASMAVATSRDGSRRRARMWLKRAEALVSQVGKGTSAIEIVTPTAKYVGAARVALGDDPSADDPGTRLAIAWLLWEIGYLKDAVRHAQGALGGLSDALRTGPRITTINDFVRMDGLFAAASAGLGAIVAMGAAARGKSGEARDAIATALARTESMGWPSLTPSEQAEINACLAIGLWRAGDGAAALERLRMASEAAVRLARRGELVAFRRLCQALLELLGPNRASPIWATWLIAAAGSGANDAAGMIASYVRWLPQDALASVGGDPSSAALMGYDR